MCINIRGFTAFVSWQHLNIPQTYSSQAVQRKIMIFIYFTQIFVDFFFIVRRLESRSLSLKFINRQW
jgi:hypothetical protein